ncbi:MAG: hypothetical protein M0R76_14365 [Proteobacteria bacterium]|nr:hypothetical protein [Pseudomonadota bacterium]
MNELAQYLLENLFVDFQGEVTTDAVRAFLRHDESADSRALLQKIIEEKGIDELLEVLADLLTQEIAKVLDAPTIRGHLINYSEA